MNILFYRYNSICEPDMIEALQELGHSVDEERSEMTNKQVSPSEAIENVAELLNGKAYDCVLSVNFYPVLAEICNIYRLRYLCWTVDSPVLELYSDSLRHPWNRIFLFDYAQYQDFVAQNPEHIYYLPLATNAKRWERVLGDTSNPAQKQFAHDVAFVGSLYTEKNPYDELELPPYMHM